MSAKRDVNRGRPAEPVAMEALALENTRLYAEAERRRQTAADDRSLKRRGCPAPGLAKRRVEDERLA